MNEVEDYYLKHFGVKGMKWGVRKKRETKGPRTYKDADGNIWTTSSPVSRAKEKGLIEQPNKTNKRQSKSNEAKVGSVTTKQGTKISFTKDKTPALAKLIAKMSPKVRELLENSENMTIKGPDGKTVGEMQLYKEGKDSLNVVWVGVRNKERGKGYASAAMRGAVQFAKENNMKQVTLEVPGNSPDALHIYEKMGFKKGKTISDDDDVWGGLTEMKLDLNDTIQHYGVKGMKWGVRKKRGSGPTRQQRKAQRRLTKEARKDYRKYKKVDKDWTPYERSAQVRKINDKKRNVKGYDEAFKKGSKQVDRTDKIIGTTASIASKAFIAREAMRITNPEAYAKASRVVDSAYRGAGQYAKYAAQSVTPSKYTVKARSKIDAILVN